MVLTLAGVGFHTAAAQEDEIRMLKLTGLDGYLEYRVTDDNQSRERSGTGISWDSSELEYRESLRLDFDGYIYHPRLLRFQLGSQTELLQETNEGSAVQTSQNNRLLLGGDFRLIFLEEHPYTLTLQGNREELDVSQPFASSYTITSTTLGASLAIKKGPVPVDMTYSQNTVVGSDAGRDINETQDDLLIRGEYEITQRSRGDIEYHWTKATQESINKMISTHQFALSNLTTLGADENLRFFGHARLQQQSGTTNSDNYTFRESLDWRHTDNLRSRYNIGYSLNEVEGDRIDLWDGSASVSYSLYDSLQTEAEVYGRFQDATTGAVSTIGQIASVSYTKRLGRWGRFSAHVRGSNEILERTPTVDEGWVRDESHQVSFGIPIQLGQPDIRVGSIWVTAENNLRVYRLRQDYLISTRNGFTELIVLAGGDIPLDSTILVDYRYALPGKGVVQTRGGSVDLRYQFRQWFSVYGAYDQNKQEQVEGELTSRLESRERRAFGGRFQWRWFEVGADYEDVESTFSPVTTLSEWGAVSFDPLRGWHVRLSASHRDSKFSDTGRKLKAIDAHVLLSGQITRRGMLEVEADYRQQRWENFDTANNLDALGVTLGYVMRYQLLILDIRARYSNIEQLGQKETKDYVRVSLRREF